MTTIRDNASALQYLAEIGHTCTVTETSRGPVVIEKRFCPRCGGAGVLECYRGLNGGVCFQCEGFNSRETVHTPIVSYARRVKAAVAKEAKRLRDEPKRLAAWEAKAEAKLEKLLAGQRRWCEAKGYGPITFAELDAKRAAERATKDAASGHVGTVGARTTFDVTFVRVVHFDTAFGTTGIWTFVDASGNQLVWKTSGVLNDETGTMVSHSRREQGDFTFQIKATVKEHGEYRGVKQTSLSRVVVLAHTETPKIKAA